MLFVYRILSVIPRTKTQKQPKKKKRKIYTCKLDTENKPVVAKGIREENNKKWLTIKYRVPFGVNKNLLKLDLGRVMHTQVCAKTIKLYTFKDIKIKS